MTHRANASQRLLAVSLLLVLFGALLALNGDSLTVTTAGVLVASTGVALLIPFCLQKLSHPLDRRSVLTISFCLMLMPAGVFLAFQRPGVEVRLGQLEPVPGSPITMSGLVREKRPPSGDVAPISATAGSFSLAQGMPPGASPEPQGDSTIVLELPILPRDCRRLVRAIGGSCDGTLRPPRTGAETVTVESARPADPLIVEVQPVDAEAVRLDESTMPGQQRVPTEWDLHFDGGRTEVHFGCGVGMLLEVKQPPEKELVHCGGPAVDYEVQVSQARGLLAFLSLDQLSEFTLGLNAERAEATVEGGNLLISGKPDKLPSDRAEVTLGGEAGHPVMFSVAQAKETAQNKLALSTDRTEDVSVNQQGQVPTWPHQHPELFFFLLSVLAAALVPALFDFFVSRLPK